MTVINSNESNKLNIIDNISSELEESNKQLKEKVKMMEDDKLAALKAKMANKTSETTVEVSTPVKKERSINFGVVGTGQCGGRISEAFYKLGYSAIAINTAKQDLKFINIPETNKFLIEYGLGGAAKDLSIGREAAESVKDELAEFIDAKLEDSQVNILCLSLGGGSGAGSCDTMIDILSATGKPLVVIAALPMNTEDAQTKANTVETLAKLAKYSQSRKVNNLIVVDNAKIASLLSNISQLDFYGKANDIIVEPIDIFNNLSSMPSHVKTLDPMEFGKMLMDGEGLSVYGSFDVSNYEDETSIAEAIIANLSGNLLATGFDIKQAKYVGALIIANKSVWDKIPQASVDYAMGMINEACSNPLGVFKGVYVVDMPEDIVRVYSFFSGLGLPDSRVNQLKAESKLQLEASKEKDKQRSLNLNIDTGNDAVSEAQKIRDKIAAKTSPFAKFTQKVVDKRK